MKRTSDIFRELADKRIEGDLKNCEGLFFVGFSGVNSADLTTLRRELHSSGSRMFVTKNSFVSQTMKKANKDAAVIDFLNGPTALVFVSEDPVKPAKVLVEFLKTHETMKLRGGFVRDRLIQTSDFKMLASIPSRSVLYQQIAIGCNGPLSKLVQSLNQITAKLCYALKAVADKKDKEKK